MVTLAGAMQHTLTRQHYTACTIHSQPAQTQPTKQQHPPSVQSRWPCSCLAHSPHSRLHIAPCYCCCCCHVCIVLVPGYGSYTTMNDCLHPESVESAQVPGEGTSCSNGAALAQQAAADSSNSAGAARHVDVSRTAVARALATEAVAHSAQCVHASRLRTRSAIAAATTAATNPYILNACWAWALCTSHLTKRERRYQLQPPSESALSTLTTLTTFTPKGQGILCLLKAMVCRGLT